MALRRMDIESVVVGSGPLPSLVVLRPRDEQDGSPELQLPIRIGSIEATAISMGVNPREGRRPMTHDLLVSSIEALGASCSSVRIVGVEGTIFFAQVELLRDDGGQVLVDARPSDAIALAVRAEAPIFAEEDVLSVAALPDFRSVEKDEQERELAEFHEFVESLSPEDFNVSPNAGEE
ncbi:bifunctional nuclease family protein [Olsenella sp. An290]|uniref:bifunctional nuclease family protein n=1 Tax=Olsenella sp. An290 TaxID=1965625 RepID=UPI000B376C12|nr:bifunctional nuclease family protein [Olsenella sp. An290]OUO34472.1 hypothetical protein B5F84_06405 [Olsenella sp. An290]